jgi:hypothetical protein
MANGHVRQALYDARRRKRVACVTERMQNEMALVAQCQSARERERVDGW